METPQEELRESHSDNDSEQYPEDDIPEEEEEDEEEDEDEQYEEDYKVSPQSSSITPMLDDFEVYFSESLFCV